MPLLQNQCRSNGVVLHWSNDMEQTPDTFKQTKNLNMFKDNLKENYLKELKNSISC